jgi:6-methylsalicylate decarboxylase
MTPPRIDLHEHFFPDARFGADRLRHLGEETGWRFPPENFPWSPEKNLWFMDQLGIETSMLSLTGSPGGDGVGIANREFARFLNTTAHQAVIGHPGRFGFFANLPIPSDTDAALEELAYALDVLEAAGVNLTSSYGKGAIRRSRCLRPDLGGARPSGCRRLHPRRPDAEQQPVPEPPGADPCRGSPQRDL